MEKKTALDLACESLGWLSPCSYGRCNFQFNCPVKAQQNRGWDEERRMECGKYIKQQLQQQADIPDGWDVVKEIYEKAKKEKERSRRYERYFENTKPRLYVEENYHMGMAFGLDIILNFIKDKLDEAGIEVK